MSALTPEAIAAGLTEMQQEVVASGAGNRAACCEVLAFEPSLFDHITLDGQFGRLSLATPLGLEIRALLQRNSA